LAKNGFVCVRFDSQLPTLPESKGTSPRITPGCAHSGPGSPFFAPARRFGRSAAPLIRFFVSVYSSRQNDSLARGGTARFHHRRRLRSGPPPRVDPEVRRPRHHHQRQRPTIHIFIVGGSLFPPLYKTHSNNCLPSSVQWPRGAVPPPTEGCPPCTSGRSGLV
jgi:hypothetical protein